MILAWCQCGHNAKWHTDGGPCAYWATELDDAGDLVPVVCGESCQVLRLEHIDVVTA